MIIVEQDDMDFKQSCFGGMTKAVKDFVSSAWSKVDDSVLGNSARAIFNETKSVIASTFENDRIRRLKASVRSARETTDDNFFKELNDIGKLQHAPGAMQHLLMANPFLRTLYHKGAVDGYSDSYTDIQPDAVGEDHVHYRLATNGIVTMDPTDGKYYSASYHDEELEMYEELDIVEQSMIMRAWDQTNRYLKHGGDDPTSIYNSSMGRSWAASAFDLLVEDL